MKPARQAAGDVSVSANWGVGSARGRASPASDPSTRSSMRATGDSGNAHPSIGTTSASTAAPAVGRTISAACTLDISCADTGSSDSLSPARVSTIAPKTTVGPGCPRRSTCAVQPACSLPRRAAATSGRDSPSVASAAGDPSTVTTTATTGSWRRYAQPRTVVVPGVASAGPSTAPFARTAGTRAIVRSTRPSLCADRASAPRSRDAGAGRVKRPARSAVRRTTHGRTGPPTCP